VGDLLLPGGGPVRFPTKNEEQAEAASDLDRFLICADCGTHLFVGDQSTCSICRHVYCEECFEDHDCGFMSAQAEASDM
jgi:hypothetical protein